MENNNKKEEKNNVNYLKNFVLIFGIFYLLMGIALVLLISVLIAFIPVEYITYLNEFIAGINPFNINLFTIINIFGIIFIVIGALFTLEYIFIGYEIGNYQLYGKIISLIQIWFFPLGTFAGYLIFSELRH